MTGHRLLQAAEDIFDGSPGIFNSTNPTADQTIEEIFGQGNERDPISLIISIVILAPCILACFFQISYKIKKRRSDRLEREIQEVTTNPTSRRMVLDEIFKGSSKMVEFPSNKRRVQVKKYRKKTAEERRLGCSADEEELELSSSAGDNANHFDEEMGSVQGRMIICISDKNNCEEKATSSDDASASSIDSCESGIYCDNNSNKGPNLVEEEELPSVATVSTTVDLTDGADSPDTQRSIKRISPNCPRDSFDAEQTFILTKLSIPDVDENESSWNASALSPKLTPNPYDESDLDDEKIGRNFRTPSNALSRNSSYELAMSSTLCQEITANKTSSGLIIPIISDDEDDDEDEEEKVICRSSIFRNEAQGEAKIEPSSSTLTAVTSNVVDPGVNNVDGLLSSLERFRRESVDLSIGSDADSRLKITVPLTNVESIITDTSSKAETSSHISYFSFEDETIASDQADICAICICPYDEGDIRIFSKRCPHSFHKDCLFEWLVKDHHECPCCRSEMVSKSEVKETSASLVGTERLAQALASTMVEAPPLRFPQARIARQMIERARQRQRRRRSAQNESNDESSARRNTVNSHWIWNSRFETTPRNLSSVNETFPQPAGLSQSSTTTSRNQVSPSPTPLQARSFDAIIMESQPTGDLASRSYDAVTNVPQQTSQVQGSSRNAASNNPRNFHNHWANWNNAQLTRTPRRSNSTQAPSSPSTSPLGRLRRSGSGTSPRPESLAVTVLPAV